MHNPEDEHVLTLNAVQDNVLANSQTSISGPKVRLAGTPDARKTGDHQKTVGDRFDQMIGDLDTAAFLGYMEPNVIEVGFSALCDPMRHLTVAARSIPQEAAPGRVL